jgi:hypothetical protein
MLIEVINFKKGKCFEELFLQLIDNKILKKVTSATLLKKREEEFNISCTNNARLLHD